MPTQQSDLYQTASHQLTENGFCILNEYAGEAMISRLRQRTDEIIASEGEDAGREFKQEPQTLRLANLVNKGVIFQQLIMDPVILSLVSVVLGSEFKLSSLNYRAALPLSDWAQPLHCDTGALPDNKGNSVCNVIWMLDDFTTMNGATRLISGSHRTGHLPEQILPDPSAAHPEEILITGKVGTVAVINAHIWHGGTANRTRSQRRAIHSFYCRRDKPQQQYQKKLLDSQVQATNDEKLRWLLALDDIENDRLCSEITGMSGFMK
jgi:ectoine hydroxylase-related dioxygenase (phytanoyl-CoA dioxygenase family)